MKIHPTFRAAEYPVDWSRLTVLSVALGKLPCYGEPDPYLAHLVDRDPPALSEARMEDLRGLARAGVTPEEILARLSPDELARLPY